MDKNYGGIVWTNHALQRMEERRIKQGDAWATWKRPDSSEYEKIKDVWIYQRVFGHEMIEVVAKKKDKGSWIVLSVWSKYVGDTKIQRKKNFITGLLSLLFLPKK